MTNQTAAAKVEAGAKPEDAIRIPGMDNFVPVNGNGTRTSADIANDILTEVRIPSVTPPGGIKEDILALPAPGSVTPLPVAEPAPVAGPVAETPPSSPSKAAGPGFRFQTHKPPVPKAAAAPVVPVAQRPEGEKPRVTLKLVTSSAEVEVPAPAPVAKAPAPEPAPALAAAATSGLSRDEKVEMARRAARKSPEEEVEEPIATKPFPWLLVLGAALVFGLAGWFGVYYLRSNPPVVQLPPINQSVVDKLNTQVESLRASLTQATSNLFNVQKTLTAEQANTGELQSKLAAADAFVITLQAQLASNVETLSGNAETIAGLQTELKALNVQVADFQSRLSQLQGEAGKVPALTEENGKLLARVRLSVTALSDLLALIKAKDATIAAQTATIAANGETIADQQGQIEGLSLEVTAANDARVQAEAEAKAKLEELEAAKAQAAASTPAPAPVAEAITEALASSTDNGTLLGSGGTVNVTSNASSLLDFTNLPPRPLIEKVTAPAAPKKAVKAPALDENGCPVSGPNRTPCLDKLSKSAPAAVPATSGMVTVYDRTTGQYKNVPFKVR